METDSDFEALYGFPMPRVAWKGQMEPNEAESEHSLDYSKSKDVYSERDQRKTLMMPFGFFERTVAAAGEHSTGSSMLPDTPKSLRQPKQEEFDNIIESGGSVEAQLDFDVPNSKRTRMMTPSTPEGQKSFLPDDPPPWAGFVNSVVPDVEWEFPTNILGMQYQQKGILNFFETLPRLKAHFLKDFCDYVEFSSLTSTISDFTLHPESSSTYRPLLSESRKVLPPPTLQCLSLKESGPLGLKLRKSPSLVHLAQMKVTATPPMLSTLANEANSKCATSLSVSQQEKQKASNFPASTLKIGTWERSSRHEGDLVAKCYYAKRKLVWEILEGGLKNKIEVPWADIIALKSNYKDSNELGVLEIEVSKTPLFYKEINPQPRKHTIWHPSSDFTGGQASVCKWHYLQFSPGVLNKHYEKLIQFDPQLKLLSEKGMNTEAGSAFLDRNCESGKGSYDILKKGFHEGGGGSVKAPSLMRFIDSFIGNRSFINGDDIPLLASAALPKGQSAEYNNSEKIHHTCLTPKFETIKLESVVADPISLKAPPFSTKEEKFEEGNVDNLRANGFEAMKQPPYFSAKVIGGMFTGSSEVASMSSTNCNPSYNDRRMLDDLAYHLFADSSSKQIVNVEGSLAMEESSHAQMESSLLEEFPDSLSFPQSSSIPHDQYIDELEECNGQTMRRTLPEDMVKFYLESGEVPKFHPNYTNVNLLPLPPSSSSHLFDPSLSGMEFLQTLRSCNDLE